MSKNKNEDKELVDMLLKLNIKYAIEDSKNKFLIDMESVIRKKDFNYYRHAIGIIEDINYVHTCKNTNRIIRYEKDYLLNNYNKDIVRKYYDSRIEYNKKRSVLVKGWWNIIIISINCLKIKTTKIIIHI